MASSEDDMVNTPGGLEDDLFGSDDDAPVEKTRDLSDEDLDSGDDEGRRDRAPREEPEEDDSNDRVARVLETTVSRHVLPQPFDGEVGNPFPDNLSQLIQKPVKLIARSKISRYRAASLRSEDL